MPRKRTGLNIPRSAAPLARCQAQNQGMMDFRTATVEDLAGIHAVWWAADPFDAFNHNPWFRHVLRTGSMMVATVEGRVVGFAGVREVSDTKVVSDCFVDPEHQARGIGTGLLSRLLPLEGPVMTLASQDPKARSLYSRFGMAPKWECHYVEGDPTRVDPGAMTAREVTAYPIAESDFAHLREDLGCRFLEMGNGHAAVSGDTIESCIVTASIVMPSGDPGAVLSTVLGWTAGRGMPNVNLQISELHPAFTLLTAAGFVVTGVDTFMASPGAKVPDPARTTFNGDILRLIE